MEINFLKWGDDFGHMHVGQLVVVAKFVLDMLGLRCIVDGQEDPVIR